MLRRSKRTIKSAVTEECSAQEPSSKRKRKLKEVSDSSHEDNSSGEEFTVSDTKSNVNSCALNLSESESDSDNSILCNNKKKEKSIPVEDANLSSESEEDVVCKTDFDFSSVIKSQKATKSFERNTNSKSFTSNSSKVEERCDKLDIAKMLCKGEKLEENPILDDIEETEDKQPKQDRDYKIPDVVEVTIKLPNNVKCKKDQDMESLLKRRMNTICKETQILVHKVDLLLWICFGNRLNKILNSPNVMASALSLIPSEKAYPPSKCDLNYLENYINWFSKKIKVASKTEPIKKITVLSLVEQFSHCIARTRYDFIAMFISMLRSLGLSVRLVINLNAVSIKPNTEQLSSTLNDDNNIKLPKNSSKTTLKQKTPAKSEYFDKKTGKTSNKKTGSKNALKNIKPKSKVKKEDISDISTDEEIFLKKQTNQKSKDVKKSPAKSQKSNRKSSLSTTNKSLANENKNSKSRKSLLKEKIDRRVLSTDEDNHSSEEIKISKKTKTDIWAEVFLEMEEKWFCVDVVGKRIHCIKEIYNSTSHPMRYVLAWYNDNSIKEVTKRYDPQFHTLTRKIRVDQKWWDSTLRPYKPSSSAREQEEDEDLDKQLEDVLPKTISEFKDHPLYALERHLLKFQAIYPPEPPIIGYVRNEPVYSREYVHELNGRENWLKEARVVKIGEKFYKQVKARPRFDRNGVRTDPPPLELFGIWQTEPYDPPTAMDGKVPRNCYGNVDLFKPCMLPKGTVHLQLPGLLRIAKKLDIDCAPAVVGFDFHSGGSHPVNDGFIVCQEFKETLIDAWNQEMEESRKREQKRYEDRVYGNWRRLIKAALIREKLKIKYNYFEDDKKKPSTSKVLNKNK